MGRIIILEGADLTGKTTLAEALKRNHGFHRWHLRAPSGETEWQYRDLLLGCLGHAEDIVCDRWHLGTFIYQYALGIGVSPIPAATYFAVVDQLHRHGARTVVVKCRDHELTRRYLAHVRGERRERDNLDTVLAANRMYDLLSNCGELAGRHRIAGSVDTTFTDVSKMDGLAAAIASAELE